MPTYVTTSLRLILCACLLMPWGTPAGAWNDDYRSYSNPNFQINDYQQNFRNRLDLSTFRPNITLPTFEIRTPIAPALNINSWTMRLPEIKVPDIGNSVWTFERVTNNFSPQLKGYDHYQANINFNFNDNIAPRSVMMDIGKMKFQQGTQTPERYTRVYQDQIGNTFTKVRTEQMSRMNEGFNTFVQHFQKEGKLAYANQLLNPMTRPQNIPPEPPLEVTDGFQEKWVLNTLDEQGRRQKVTYDLSVDSMKSKELGRFVSEYSGRFSDGKQAYQFTVTAPHDFNGKMTSLSVKIEGKGFPTAHIEWKPVDGQSAEEAFSLLRQNLPAPLFVGPNSSLRLNGVDIAEPPLHVTPNGDISPKQIGSAKDLVNLMGKEDLGIKVSFSPAKEAGGGFSLMNSLKNLGYMLTGRWSEVKGMRQELTSMAKNDPAKFVLAAEFNDPSFMGVKDLRTALESSKRIRVPQQKIELTSVGKLETQTQAGVRGPDSAASRTGFFTRAIEVLTAPVGVAFNAAIGAIKTSLGVVFGGQLKEEPLKGYHMISSPTDREGLITPGKGKMEFFLKDELDPPHLAPSAVFEIRNDFRTPPLLNILPHSSLVSLKKGADPSNADVYFNKPPAEFVERLRLAESIDLYFHGYNVGTNKSLNIRKSFAELLDLQGYKNINALVTWSGDMGANFLAKAFYFNRSVRSTRLSWEGVATTVDFLKTHNPNIKINATTHSLGAGMLLEAANRGVKFGKVVLIVPAIDNEALSPGGRYEKALQNIDELVVVYSRNQWEVFGPPYMLGRFDRALGDVGPSGVVNHPNFTAIDATRTSRNHDYGIHIKDHGDIYGEKMIEMLIKHFRGF